MRKALPRVVFAGILALLVAFIPPGLVNLAQETPRAAEGRDELQAELDHARQLAAAGRVEAAAAIYRRVLQADAASFEAHFELGHLLVSQQKLDEARAHLQAAVELNPSFAEAHSRLAQTLLLLNDLPGAERELIAAAGLD